MLLTESMPDLHHGFEHLTGRTDRTLAQKAGQPATRMLN